MTITSIKFVQIAKQIANYPTKYYKGRKCYGSTNYENGGCGRSIGSVYTCDCRGYIIWCLRKAGISISSPGTNWMIRNQMTSVQKFTKLSELQPGMVVFKSRTDTSKMSEAYLSGGNRYKASIGNIDVYHIGIVIQTSPSLIIKHCSSSGNSTGILTDTTIGKWNWCGWVQWVEPNTEQTTTVIEQIKKITSTIAKVIGGKLNLRSEKSTQSQRILQIPNGAQVSVLDSNDEEWSYIQYNSKRGYVKNDYLQNV